ncbi:MAG TPA: hypothetical protein VK750_01085, partial [Cytophagaceae bacterium]|nr:hypothetical protein [Cytophagaceae bacterium]
SLTELQDVVYTNDPSQLYFNAYVYGYGRASNSFFFQVWENDAATISGGIGVFPTPIAAPNFATNDMWMSVVEVDWVGWKLVSVPYSSFKPASNPLSGGGGNRIKEPLKISGMAIEVDSYPANQQTVELAFDMITVTHNAPFQP